MIKKKWALNNKDNNGTMGQWAQSFPACINTSKTPIATIQHQESKAKFAVQKKKKKKKCLVVQQMIFISFFFFLVYFLIVFFYCTNLNVK